MHGSTLRERQRQLREDAILDAAHELLLEQGYAAMSMDDVAARVGISKATLYQHVASKEDLIVQVILRAMERGEQQINALDPTLPAIQRLEQLVRNAITGRSDFWTARPMLPPSLVRDNARYQEQAQRIRYTIADMVDAAKAEGDIAPHLATPVIVQLIVSTIRDMSYGELLADGEIERAMVSDTLIDLLLNGLRTRSKLDSVSGKLESV